MALTLGVSAALSQLTLHCHLLLESTKSVRLVETLPFSSHIKLITGCKSQTPSVRSPISPHVLSLRTAIPQRRQHPKTSNCPCLRSSPGHTVSPHSDEVEAGMSLGLACWGGEISGIFSPCLYTLTVTSIFSPPYLFFTLMLYLPESSAVTP